jgi:hypothetical protein
VNTAQFMDAATGSPTPAVHWQVAADRRGPGKNLAGAFHFPEHVLVDPSFLSTLPDGERRAGMAEVVKTGLLAGEPLWELPDDDMIPACAAFKSAVVISDPYEREGRRAILNLGHTFAHALEAGSGYELRHGDAVAGLLAALEAGPRVTSHGRCWLQNPSASNAIAPRDAPREIRRGRLTSCFGDEGGYVIRSPRAT